MANNHMTTVIDEFRAQRGLIDAEEMATLLGMNKDVLYRKTKAGLVPHFRILGRVKYDPAKIAVWLAQHQVG